MRRRDTMLIMRGSDGFGPDLFVERDAPTEQGHRVALVVHQSNRLVKEVFEATPDKARATLRRFAHEAVDAMFNGSE